MKHNIVHLERIEIVYRVGLLHGRVCEMTKNRTDHHFLAGNVLVCQIKPWCRLSHAVTSHRVIYDQQYLMTACIY